MDIDKIIAKAQMNHKGWELNNIHEEGDFFKCMSVYVFDVDRREMRMLGIPEEGFYEVANSPLDELNKIGIYELAGHTLTLLDKFYRNILNEKKLDELSASISCYVSQTQVYDTVRVHFSEDSDLRPHIFLSVYKSRKKFDKRLLRPAICGHEKRLMDVDEVYDMFKQIFESDLARHPDWV